MSKNPKDTPPPTDPPEGQEPPPSNDPPEPPANPPDPDPEHVAEEHGEKVPAWGEALIGKVDGISDMLSSVIPAPGDGGDNHDDTPVKLPWHKRGLGKS